MSTQNSFPSHITAVKHTSRVARKSGCLCNAQNGLEVREASPMTQVLVNAMTAIMKFPPIWEAARANARKSIADRGMKIGIDIARGMRLLSTVDWESRIAQVIDPNLAYPPYYSMPFHGYDEGNLAWQPALEFELVARAVHADVMDPAKTVLDPRGDNVMRSEFHRLAVEVMDSWGCPDVRDAVDFGCAVGVSTRALRSAFPNASIIGLDASPYFIAMAEYLQDSRQGDAGEKNAKNITFHHALVERSGLPDASTDVVSMSLLSHELPAAVAVEIMQEAFRILRPNGVLMIMDMDPKSATAQRILNNPFASAAFRSTEPWLAEYIGLDMEGHLSSVGFDRIAVRHNTPSHKTVVALKAA